MGSVYEVVKLRLRIEGFPVRIQKPNREPLSPGQLAGVEIKIDIKIDTNLYSVVEGPKPQTCSDMHRPSLRKLLF